MLLSIHNMAAAFLSSPELVLDPAEAKAMSDGIMEVSRHYPMTVDPKTMAWVNLAIVCGGVYGPRFMVIRSRARTAPKPIAINRPRPEPNQNVNGAPPVPTAAPVTNPSQLFGGMDGTENEGF